MELGNDDEQQKQKRNELRVRTVTQVTRRT